MTILSRCQRFDLRRVEPEILVDHLGRIAEREGMKIEQDALALIARRLDLGPTGAGDLLLLGRLVGLLAHAVDQATDGSPIRARLRYVGPEPGAH